MIKDQVMVRNPQCQAGGSNPGQGDGSELSPALTLSHAKVCAPPEANIVPCHIGTTVQTQSSCQWRRRMLFDLAVAGASPCPGGCCSVMVTEEGERQKKMLFWGC